MNETLSVITLYKPVTLRAFYAMMMHAHKERFFRSYMADSLYMIGRYIYAQKGVEYPFKAYSEHVGESERKPDMRTEKEIMDSLVSRLRGGSK